MFEQRSLNWFETADGAYRVMKNEYSPKWHIQLREGEKWIELVTPSEYPSQQAALDRGTEIVRLRSPEIPA